MSLNSSQEIIEEIRCGKMVVLIDDEDRENEGDLVMAANCVKPEHINFMAHHARGLICMPISRAKSDALGLEPMARRNGTAHGTQFTCSIEAASGVTTGISAADRAHTVRTAAQAGASAQDLVQPGHIFPLIAEPGGVLVRAGHTEAACDLARLAGYEESAVICEIMNDDGSMARRPELERFAKLQGLKIGTIADLIHFRVINESTVQALGARPVLTDHGAFQLHRFRDRINGSVHFALVHGRISAGQPTLIRVQQGLTARDLLGIQAAGSSGWNIQRCLRRIVEEGAGVLVLLAGSESSDDLLNSVEPAEGATRTVRQRKVSSHHHSLMIGVGSQILRQLGLGQLRLMGRNRKYHAISGFDLEVVEYLQPDSLVPPPPILLASAL
ncbi:3,4-dihydroxy-2-butanone-4-phosphate synthase [Pseudomonas typographi]|uniref:3,4-dihydroxy-2-butanone 4-phosphate synthase n=1 Tax=Pseudomonas typographi TaxID=2715964 RepID=A0ABR7Z1Q4_9PSED|nr:3,4-dihydroxy-2-butanone-4-phosphate synthase [Pseudomonas typographi]MBD1551517.1 3,4-dihydroxy-2-butanone-4-phosphate synthase [Pseudomonas typographi]MBD1587497.1 3,4-dihydroxy-2-butanone-4-phosphate synthase [Pseudomonas typographi]MBD1599420.1 3,4-dihydroxy-2-butanone-4-phosphate synthase [Pseudomonas typographi]